MSAGERSQLVSGGNLTFDLGIRVNRSDNQFSIGDWLGGASVADSLRTLYSGDGSTITFYNQSLGGNVGSSFAYGYARSGSYAQIELWYNSGTFIGGGIRGRVNGCQISTDASITPTTTLDAYTSAFFLTRDGSSVPQTGQFLVKCRRKTNNPNLLWAEGAILGDSIMAENNVPVGTGPQQAAVGALIYTESEAQARAGIYSISHAGDTVANQKTAWLASPMHTRGTILQWIIIQVGINDILAGTSSSTVITSLQDLVTTIAADAPQATIFMGQMTPCKTYLDSQNAAFYARWQAVNTAISNGTITGITPVTSHIALMESSAGSGVLNTAYEADNGRKCRSYSYKFSR